MIRKVFQASGATIHTAGVVARSQEHCETAVTTFPHAALCVSVAARRPLLARWLLLGGRSVSVAARRRLFAHRLLLGGRSWRAGCGSAARRRCTSSRRARDGLPPGEAAAPGGPVPSDALRRRCREETVTGAGFVCWSPWTEEREGARPRLLRFSKWCVTQSSLSGSVKNHFQIRKWREGFLREDFRSQRK
ncbi:uncharacterized protein [Vulpes vulpes]|uniref:Uncharacterized protein n=1 Tax=Vulpes vulpes TaxID=9627 RepID=A0A3Q7RSU3_VULVU